jgi:diaminopimelate epimerase
VNLDRVVGVEFSKWHALGNAYIVVERDPTNPLNAARVTRICNVAVGIGSDGIVEVVERNGTRAEVVIWNPDGSVAEMSGNGVRIAARWLAARADQREVVILTSGREVHARMLWEPEAEIDVGRVEIGADEQIGAAGRTLVMTPVSVGNPHAVVRLDGATRADLLELGPALERHPRFPNRTNVQLVEPIGVNHLRVLVWERGAGETPSSGSSATAAAAVAVERGWCLSPVTVDLPGGELTVTLAGDLATLLGPAEEICAGTTTL